MSTNSCKMDPATVDCDVDMHVVVDADGFHCLQIPRPYNHNHSLFITALLLFLFFCPYGGDHRQTRPERKLAILSFVDHDFDGNALHHFYIVSGSIFRRQ
jgi:hypothetical protein